MALQHFHIAQWQLQNQIKYKPFVPFIKHQWSYPPVLPEILDEKYVTVLNIDFHGCTLKEAILNGKVVKTCKFKEIKDWCKDKTKSYDHAVSTVVNHGYFCFDDDKYAVVFNEKKYLQSFLRREKLNKLNEIQTKSR